MISPISVAEVELTQDGNRSPPPDASKEQRMLMLQRLLAERFKLVVLAKRKNYLNIGW
jgi:uncharacterized protein (TIGR03435 family)